ncbi:iron-sulfur cluster assembly scaffold protein [Sphingorhabdus sp.]|uniref:iron-sulfur cluster assembly scaffold protein n=1 Tax=Sphingorhabdus sp. TaxID=1902408 RepID=UPI003BAF8800|nr:iron-sulfur cluster assembly scaffold protein [Sphingomonadales bacterium]MBK9430896.1 iron-sulfur cluster assembly scaffold protein [Sphingomonadales bacterium]MBL0021048.1 iron-sulfur cluster assembly scaffold protein [Sphingomonadales bacterium]
MAEQSTTSLYSREILRLAMELPHGDHLTTPHGTASARAPVCGSEMTAEIVLTSDGNVEAVALQARACALGQASAALLRHWALGRPVQTLSETRSAFADYLSGKSDNPPDPAFAVFAAARTHSARHGAILLPFDALMAAANAIAKPG